MKIYAMPSLCDVTDFGLNNSRTNKQLLTKLASKAVQIDPPVPLPSRMAFYKTGDSSGSFFVKELEEDILIYYMKYEVKQKNLLGCKTVTQTAVWKAEGQGLPRNFVAGVVFDILLKTFPAILSDRIQTEDGKKLWLDFMWFALDHGYQVALVNFNASKCVEIENGASLRLWLTNESKDSPWAYNSLQHQGLRFLIRAKS
jgi:hypothetical protein